MLFLTIGIRLMCQKLDLIESESKTYKSQMHGHNAEQPVIPIHQVLPYIVIKTNTFGTLFN